MSSKGYVAFLRGINVGGNAIIKMGELKKAFEAMGFEKVTTVLTSGNVVFRTGPGEPAPDQGQIEGKLKKKLGLPVTVILRTSSQIADLIQSNPFKNSRLSPETKLQVSFLSKPIQADSALPMKLPMKDFQVIQVSTYEIVSAVDLATNARTPELMKFLEKRFGKGVTTRTWNTVEKVDAILREKS